MISLIASILLIRKAGYAGWEVIVPFYNTYVLFDMAFGKGIKFLWLFCPIMNIVYLIKFAFALPKRFGFGAGMGFLYLFLCPIAVWILGFGKSTFTKIEE